MERWRGEDVLLCLWEVRTGKRAKFSGGLQGEEPFHVPGQGDEVPFSLDLVEAAQVELPEAQHRFDDAEHRFRRLFAQGIGLPAFRHRQTMQHRLQCCRLLGYRRRLDEPLLPTEMVALAAWGDQRCDLRLGARRHVCLAEVAAVRQQGLGLAQRPGESPELFQHRFDLLLVVGGLLDIAWAL